MDIAQVATRSTAIAKTCQTQRAALNKGVVRQA